MAIINTNFNDPQDEEESSPLLRSILGILVTMFKLGMVCLMSYPFCLFSIKMFGEQAYLVPVFCIIILFIVVNVENAMIDDSDGEE